jgi:hypothetical protein
MKLLIITYYTSLRMVCIIRKDTITPIATVQEVLPNGTTEPG